MVDIMFLHYIIVQGIYIFNHVTDLHVECVYHFREVLIIIFDVYSTA